MTHDLDPSALELRRALEATGAPRPQLGETLARDFASGALAAEADLAAALRGTSDGIPARPAFRADLAEAFIGGTLTGEASAPGSRAEESDLAPVLDFEAGRRRLMLKVLPLVAAAALALIFVVPTLLAKLQPVPDWQMLTAAEANFANGRLEALEQPVRMSLGERAFMELQPAGEAQLEEPCWLRGDCLDVPVELGGYSEAVLFAGEAEHEAAMTVLTEDAELELSGAVVSVLPCRGGTCIVVGEGTAVVRSRKSGMSIEVPAGARVFVTSEGELELTENFVEQIERPDVGLRIGNLRSAQDDMRNQVF